MVVLIPSPTADALGDMPPTHRSAGSGSVRSGLRGLMCPRLRNLSADDGEQNLATVRACCGEQERWAPIHAIFVAARRSCSGCPRSCIVMAIAQGGRVFQRIAQPLNAICPSLLSLQT